MKLYLRIFYDTASRQTSIYELNNTTTPHAMTRATLRRVIIIIF